MPDHSAAISFAEGDDTFTGYNGRLVTPRTIKIVKALEQAASCLPTDSLKTPADTMQVLHDVMRERARQDSKWGQQDHDRGLWLDIFNEEFGESATAWLEYKFGKHEYDNDYGFDKAVKSRDELIEAIAVLVAMVESTDRFLGNSPYKPNKDGATHAKAFGLAAP